MNKKTLIMILVIPAMRTGVAILRNLDANNTGTDDIAADQLDTAIASIEKWASQT